jgi:FtsH-binding integral membrane protein
VAQSERVINAKETTMNDNKRVFALLSLGLLIAALLVPIFMAAFPHRTGFPFAFGLTAGLLALVFGVLSWRDRIGKTVATALLSILIVGGGSSVVIYLLRGLPAAEEARARSQQAATAVSDQ